MILLSILNQDSDEHCIKRSYVVGYLLYERLFKNSWKLHVIDFQNNVQVFPEWNRFDQAMIGKLTF